MTSSEIGRQRGLHGNLQEVFDLGERMLLLQSVRPGRSFLLLRLTANPVWFSSLSYFLNAFWNGSGVLSSITIITLMLIRLYAWLLTLSFRLVLKALHIRKGLTNG